MAGRYAGSGEDRYSHRQCTPCRGGVHGPCRASCRTDLRCCPWWPGARLPGDATIIEDEEEKPGFRLIDLGERKLKDLDRPVRLFELAAPGLDTQAPPAAGHRADGLARDILAGMVPVPVTPLVGRELEAAAVVDLV